MKKRYLISAVLLLFLTLFSACDNTQDVATDKPIETQSTENEPASKEHSARVKYILDEADEYIAPSYEYGVSDVGIFHMQGVRVYSFVSEKENYFVAEENEKLMVAAVKYFIFAAEGEGELCGELELGGDVDSTVLSNADIFEKRPLYIHPPVKISDIIYECRLEYVLSTQNTDAPESERKTINLSLTIKDGSVFVTKIM